MPSALKARLEKLKAAQRIAFRPMSDVERAVKLAFLLDKLKREEEQQQPESPAGRLAAPFAG